MKTSIIPALIAAALLVVHARDADAQALSAGGDFNAAIRPDGSVITWGRGNSPVAPIGTNFKAVSAGSNHLLSLTNDGVIVLTGSHDAVPTSFENITITEISAGMNHSLAIDSGGFIQAWGNNANNKVSDAPDTPGFTSVAAGAQHSLALHSVGTVSAWGSNVVGDDTTNQSVVPNTVNSTGAMAIAAGNNHSVALLNNRTIAAWGTDSEGQSIAPSGNTFTAISAGANHSLALESDGTVRGWGVFEDSSSVVPSILTTNAVYITSGAAHSYVVHSDGTLTGYGDNSVGQLDTPTPLDPPLLPTTAEWTGGGGDYLDSHRWAQKIPSTALSDAVFNAPGTYEIDFGNTAMAANLTVSAGDISFNNTTSHQYLVGSDIRVENSDTKFRFAGTVGAQNADINQGLMEVKQGAVLNVSDSIDTRNGGVLDVKGTVNTANVDNAGQMNVASTGTLNVSNDFSSTGAFNVDGTLNLTGASAVYSVTGSAEFGGTGTFNGDVAIADGGTVSPGNSIGTLTVNGDTTFGPDGRFRLEIAELHEGGGGVGDLLATTTLDITAGTAADPNERFVIELAQLPSNFDPFQSYTLTFVTTSGGITTDGNGVFDSSRFFVDTSGFTGPFGDFSVQLSSDGNDLVLHHTAIPEPSSFVILGLALGGLGYRARRKANKAKSAAAATDDSAGSQV